MDLRVCAGVLCLALLPSGLSGRAQAVGTTATVLRVDHVAVYVADLKKSAAFYTDTFGFEQVPIPFEIPVQAAWLRMGQGVMLHLVEGRKEPVTNSRWDHLAVACGSMDAMIASLDRKGIAWTDITGKHAPQVRPDGVKQIFVRDPDGYWVEINDALKGK